MTKTVVYTSATYTYFSRARTLAESVRKFHPDWHFALVLPDELPPGVAIDWSLEPFDSVIRLEDLGINPLRSWVFRHNVVELCTAVKGFAMRLLQSRGFEHVIYLDPDIAVFSTLDTLTNWLDTNSILLTPHQNRPEIDPRAVIDNEWTSLKYGVYNLGFVAVRSDTEGTAFANWWAERCRLYCRDDVPNGLFTDQKWCDMVPALFGGVYVIRDPGYNVASWNISRRSIQFTTQGDLTVEGKALKFFHFTKVDHIGETMLRRYAGRNLDIIELMYWYRRQLKKHELKGIPDRYWLYNQYDDGVPISGTSRREYLTMADSDVRFLDPFAVGPGSYREWFEASFGGERGH